MIIEKIKNMFKKIFEKKPKMLEESYESEIKESTGQKIIDEKIETKLNDTNLSNKILKSTKVELTNGEKIKEILKSIGCKDELFGKIDDFEDIDAIELKKKLDNLMQYRFNKLQLSKMITQNPDILYISSEEMSDRLIEMFYITQNILIIKEIIYNNPFCITERNGLNEISDELEKYGFELDEKQYLYVRNSNILSLPIEKIKKSLEMIKNYAKSNNIDDKMFIIQNPIFVGVCDLDILKAEGGEI